MITRLFIAILTLTGVLRAAEQAGRSSLCFTVP